MSNNKNQKNQKPNESVDAEFSETPKEEKKSGKIHGDPIAEVEW